MKELILKQTSKLKLDKKGAVIDIDIIVGYLIFISIIILMVNYTLRLTAPFSTSIETLEHEKNTITVRNMIKTDFAVNDLSSVCDINYINLRRIAVTYEIRGFKMPFTDSSNISPDSINGSLIFKREGEKLRVLIGSQADPKNISVQLVIPSTVSVTNISLESEDSYNIDLDNYGNILIDFDSKVSNGDIDEIIIKPVNGVVSFWTNGVELSNCFVGDLSLTNYCGTKGITGPRTSFNRYGLMTDGRTDYYIKLVGDIWWTR